LIVSGQITAFIAYGVCYGVLLIQSDKIIIKKINRGSMKFFQKTAISLMIAVSLTACSDKNDKKETASTETAVSTHTPQAKTSSQFVEMLTYVPADTAYLMANSETVPEEVLAFQMKRLQTVVAALSANIKSITAATDGKDKTTENKTDTSEAKDVTATDVGDFFEALLKEVSGNLNKEGLAKLGIKTDGHGMIYEFNMLPVMRYELSNKEAFKALLVRAEKTSGYKIEWNKCGEHDCLISKEGKELNIAAVFINNQVVIAPFTTDKKQLLMDHLLGVKKPEKSYKPADWSSFLAENNYKGYSEGFVKLDSMVDKFERFILTQEKQKQGDRFDEQAFKGCFAVAKAHVKNVPELVFGTKQLSEKSVQYEIVAKTSTEVSTVLQGLPNKLTGMQQPTNPVITFGLNLNMPNVRNAMTQYINFVAKSGEEHKCAAIDPIALRKAIGGLSMAMTMGASQFKSVFVALDKVEFDDNGKPSTVEAFGSVMADDPMALLQMLAMVNPQFATLQLPDDGKPVKLPKGIIPAGPISPEISLSRQGKTLNVLIGNDQMALKPINVKDSTILWNVTDSKRYSSLMNQAVKQTPQAGDADTKNMLEMMSALGEFSGVISQQIGFDKRGVVIDYNVTY
jgi:hypothetical protein